MVKCERLINIFTVAQEMVLETSGMKTNILSHNQNVKLWFSLSILPVGQNLVQKQPRHASVKLNLFSHSVVQYLETLLHCCHIYSVVSHENQSWSPGDLIVVLQLAILPQILAFLARRYF